MVGSSSVSLRGHLSVVLEALHVVNDFIYHSDAIHLSQDSPIPELTAVSEH